MKKRFLALFLTVILALTMIIGFTGCKNGQLVEEYEYDGVYMNPLVKDSYETIDELFAFVYEDTFLKIYEDGTWEIVTPMFLFFDSSIDEGTYIVEDGVYIFEGFEYGMDAYGKEKSDGFEIYFMVPDGFGYTKAMAIYYE